MIGLAIQPFSLLRVLENARIVKRDLDPGISLQQLSKGKVRLRYASFARPTRLLLPTVFTRFRTTCKQKERQLTLARESISLQARSSK
jgi:hypothetical protein